MIKLTEKKELPVTEFRDQEARLVRRLPTGNPSDWQVLVDLGWVWKSMPADVQEKYEAEYQKMMRNAHP